MTGGGGSYEMRVGEISDVLGFKGWVMMCGPDLWLLVLRDLSGVRNVQQARVNRHHVNLQFALHIFACVTHDLI